MTTPLEIKERIINILKDKGMSQDEFLKKVNLSAMTFQRMNKFYPLLTNLITISEALDVSLDFLVYGKLNGTEEDESVFQHMMKYIQLDNREKMVADGVISTLLETKKE